MKQLWPTLKATCEQNALLGAVLLPFVLLPGFMIIANWRILKAIGIYLLFTPLAVGYIFFMLFLPVKLFWRILLGFVYIAVIGFFWGFWVLLFAFW
jgi:hypothetical protein